MRTLILLLMIVVGTGAMLYCRVNLGMSWEQMTAAIEGLLPRMLAISAVVAGLAATLGYIARRDRAE